MNLCLDHNPLANLPDKIECLRNLQWLSLDYTNLDSLPESIIMLENLEYLSVKTNFPYFKVPNSLNKLREKGVKVFGLGK